MTQHTSMQCPPIVGRLQARLSVGNASCEIFRIIQKDPLSGQDWEENFGVWYFATPNVVDAEFLGMWPTEQSALACAHRRLGH